MSTLVSQLEQRIGQSGDQAVIIEGETCWTLAEFFEQVNRLASALSTRGIRPGDRVALMFMNQKEFLVSFYALLKVGAVIVPINIQLPPDDILYVLLNSGSRLVITTGAFAHHFEGKPIPTLVANLSEEQAGKFPSFEDAIAQGDPHFTNDFQPEADSLRFLIYTSGTTGKPKGVMLSEENLLGNLDGIRPVLSLHPSDKILLALPLFHAYGLIIGLYALSAGSTLILVPNFAPKKILQELINRQVTVLPLVPTMFSVILNGLTTVPTEQLDALELCISGGATLPPKLHEQIEQTLNIKVLEGYGMTETSPVLAVNSRERGGIPGSVGKPLPNVQVKLVKDDGTVIRWKEGLASEEGEILVSGPNVMKGYYNLPEETAQVFDTEGYLRTGDLGRFDAEGNLYISGGRKKDLIIKAGENIAPVRIEQVLYQHPVIQNAAVIGVPHDKLGEDILACVEFKPGQSASEAELRKYCLEHLPAFMVPAAFRVYEELPKNPTGKILKPTLREQNSGQSLARNLG